jgi:hypothetical protein
VILPLEAGTGDHVGHIVIVAESQVEAADFFHSARMQVVLTGPLLSQEGTAVGPLVDDLDGLLPSLGRRRHFRVEEMDLGQRRVVAVENATHGAEERNVVPTLDDDEQLAAGREPSAETWSRWDEEASA